MNAYALQHTRFSVSIRCRPRWQPPFTWHQARTKPLTSTSMEASCLPRLG